ncbi:response regulator transcription factor [Ruegeria pomeroyi]|uniref:Response regulator transcription factor n=2 Tax=Ruegeria TaxID=97050 RepID=A0A9Q3WAP0_9RHOB|nr:MULTISPECIES: response regulator transcription factor [Ruegeria]MCE8524207.1 response regulator transcription factor [Ruegeria pomeroyi]MCE8539445.1 response regulator transcription factor [Ruegeria pomeroyi]MCE8545971.1 response regulator transcription factor [Ruegeria pomeroyi]MCG6556708.1 response regulator transcription factor [Ruegeria alba]
MSRRVLIVEDDPETRDFLAKGFAEEGFAVECAADGRDGLYHATDGGFDAMVLDRMLPGLDGLALIKSVRAAGLNTPVIMLTAMSAVDERVKGLRAGADDYLVKPFSFQELLARVEALLRRPQDTQEATTLTCRDLEMDLMRRKVTRAGREITLTPREFQILEFFLRRKNRVITRTMLLEGVWDYHFDPNTNIVDVHISKLRRQIDEGAEVPLITTVRGAGYMISDG